MLLYNLFKKLNLNKIIIINKKKQSAKVNYYKYSIKYL